MSTEIKNILSTRQPCQIFSRVNGWYTATNSWNPGKIAEWADRTPYKQEIACK